MTEQEQLEEMARIIAFDLCPNRLIHANSYGEKAQCYSDNNFAECAKIKNVVDKLCNAGYKKTFASDTQKAFKDGYIKGNIDGMLLARKETAREIFQRVINICRKEEDFQDGTVNTQLEPLYFGIMNGCAFVRGEVKELAKQYGVEVKE